MNLFKPTIVIHGTSGVILGDYLVEFFGEGIGGINLVDAAVNVGIPVPFSPSFVGLLNENGLFSNCLLNYINAVKEFTELSTFCTLDCDSFEVLLASGMVVAPDVHRLLVEAQHPDAREAFQEFSGPILISCGEKDEIINPEFCVELFEIIRRGCDANVKLSRYKCIGFTPPIEASERFNRELLKLAKRANRCH